MDPITININLNLPEKQTEWICSAIACLAQIIDQAARTAGTPFPPAAPADPDAKTIQQHDALVVRPGDTLVVGEDGKLHPVSKPEPAAQTQQNAENAAETQQETEKDDEPAPPKHTHEDVRNLYIELTHQDKKKEATTIIRKYSAKVPELPEDKLDAVYAELLALKAPEEDNDTDT